MYVSIPILVLVTCALWWAMVAVCRTGSSSAPKRVCRTVTPWVLWIAIIVVPVVVMVGIWDRVTAGSVRV